MWISKRSLFFGIALTIPFFIANALVATQAELFLSILRPLGQTVEHAAVILTQSGCRFESCSRSIPA